MINERDGQLVLSTEAGAHSELLGAADGVSPFDLDATAGALGAALDRDPAGAGGACRLLHRRWRTARLAAGSARAAGTT